MAKNFSELAIESAAEFVSALEGQYLTDRKDREWATPWVFRGQSDSSWSLVPKAWRPEGAGPLARYRAEAEELRPELWLDADERRPLHREVARHRYAERAAVRAFAKLADDVGLTLPRPNPVPGLSLAVPDERWWPAPEHPITALAQHHGIPTRLLDFTRNPLVAAFFAAREKSSAQRLSVWACSTEQVRDDRVQIVTCPRSENSFLHAQDGVFLLKTDGDDLYVRDNRTWPTLDGAFYPDGVKLFTLAASQRGRLLSILAKKRISAAHLMPTYSQVAEALHLLNEVEM